MIFATMISFSNKNSTLKLLQLLSFMKSGRRPPPPLWFFKLFHLNINRPESGVKLLPFSLKHFGCSCLHSFCYLIIDQQWWSPMRGEEQCIISSEAWYELEGKACTLNERATIRILLGGSNAHWWISFEISKDPLTIKRYLVNQETIKRSINNHKTIKQILENQKIYWQSKDNQKIYWQSKGLLIYIRYLVGVS